MTKDSNNLNEWMSELSEFLNAESSSPSHKVSAHIQNVVHRALNPSPFLVFIKLAVVAMLAGSLSTSLCPQFGIGTSSGGLMPYLMSVSPLLCQFGCGVVFVGVGVLAATLILRSEELRVLKRTKFLQVSALTASMLGLFVCFGAASLFSLEWLWLLGGISGGLISIYGGSFFREKLIFSQS